VVEGAKLSDDLIGCGLEAESVFITPTAKNQQWCAAHTALPCEIVSEKVMQEMSDEVTPQGVLTLFRMPVPPVTKLLQTASRVLILDHIQDPGNLGACFRIAAGAGCDHVITTLGCVDIYNPKVLRGGMGAHGRLHIYTMSWSEIGAVCAHMTIYGTAAKGDMTYEQVNWAKPSAIIIGNEANGMSESAQKILHKTIFIPLANQVESLNAAVSCGIILFESSRQMRQAA
jgi:TrmH family RNA methyltransferase